MGGGSDECRVQYPGTCNIVPFQFGADGAASYAAAAGQTIINVSEHVIILC